MQVMLCMTNEVLCDDLFLLYEEQYGFATKEKKSETDSKRSKIFFSFREYYDFWTKKRNCALIPGEDLFFLENNMILGGKLVFVLESQTIFLSHP